MRATPHSWVGWRWVSPYFVAITFHSAAAFVFWPLAVMLSRLPARVSPVVRAWPLRQPLWPPLTCPAQAA